MLRPRRRLLPLIEGARAAADSIRSHALRSALTALGVIIGVASIVAIVSLIEGLRGSVARDFEGLGAGGLTVYAYTPTADELKGARARLTEDDVEALRREARGIAEITPVLAVVADVSHHARTTPTWVRGTTPSYQEANRLYPAVGRFLSDVDVRTRRNVCVVGPKVLEQLGLEGDPLGRYLALDGEHYKIVGVMEARGERFGFSLDDYVVIPYTKARGLAGPYGAASITADLVVDPAFDVAAVKDGIAEVLRRRHGLRDGQPDDFRVETGAELMSAFSGIMDVVTLVACCVVGISLLVGGIGIMNIMLVAVNERTREIGLRKALGATRRDVLAQFLLEALLLCAAAGVVGVLLGMAASHGVAALVPALAAARTPAWAIVLGFGFALATGGAFGILPASRAARVEPLVSLQHE